MTKAEFQRQHPVCGAFAVGWGETRTASPTEYGGPVGRFVRTIQKRAHPTMTPDPLDFATDQLVTVLAGSAPGTLHKMACARADGVELCATDREELKTLIRRKLTERPELAAQFQRALTNMKGM